MNQQAAIVNPRKGKRSPDIGPVAVMVSSRLDMDLLLREMNIGKNDFHQLSMSRLYHGPAGISITGPFIGAPYATMLLEDLIAWGAEKILFLGWAGTLTDHVGIGDLVVPGGAFIDEGTSRHYTPEAENGRAPAPGGITAHIETLLADRKVEFHGGDIWTTDAIYRETPEKVTRFRNKNALAVEMELSALFTVAAYRNVEMGALLAVSDDLSTMEWQPGFGNKRFKQTRRDAAGLITDLCRSLSNGD